VLQPSAAANPDADRDAIVRAAAELATRVIEHCGVVVLIAVDIPDEDVADGETAAGQLTMIPRPGTRAARLMALASQMGHKAVVLSAVTYGVDGVQMRSPHRLGLYGQL
jgi:hypothetical protein